MRRCLLSIQSEDFSLLVDLTFHVVWKCLSQASFLCGVQYLQKVGAHGRDGIRSTLGQETQESKLCLRGI